MNHKNVTKLMVAWDLINQFLVGLRFDFLKNAFN